MDCVKRHRLRAPLILIITGLLAACGSPRITPQPPMVESATSVSSYSSQVVEVARTMLGKPYRYGGRSPNTGFDCSGLVYFAHQRVGKSLPRTSYGQFKATQPLKRHQLRPGDLVFFRIKRSRISHVGIYLGTDRFIHAPSSGKRVRIASLDNPYWKKRFVRGGRVF